MEKPCKVKFKKHLLLYCINKEVIVSFQTKYSFIIICAIFMYLFRKGIDIKACCEIISFED